MTDETHARLLDFLKRLKGAVTWEEAETALGWNEETIRRMMAELEAAGLIEIGYIDGCEEDAQP